MEVCSYTLKCQQYQFDFAPKATTRVNILHEDNGLYSYFRVPKSKKFHIKLSYPAKKFEEDTHKIFYILLVKFILLTFLLFILALFFTFYSLKPIRKALQLNDEFIKDILHDFNTPITSMVLNMEMLEPTVKTNPFIKRLSQGLDNMVLLQNNLRCFLTLSVSQNSEVDIALLVKNRLHYMQNIYPKIKFTYYKKSNLIKISNSDLLIRIIDNLLSNAGKYNKIKGKVDVIVENNIITIADTGKGIKDVSRVLERYYTEQDRGLGIGLHIVNKLLLELHIKMTIESTVDIGTKIILDFSQLRSV
jgi:signal transduction histidine kinase